MKKFGFATFAAGALATAIFGLAAPANAALPVLEPGNTISAGVDRLGWLNDLQPQVNVPQVDTSVRHSGR